jgi:hypothetical protein
MRDEQADCVFLILLSEEATLVSVRVYPAWVKAQHPDVALVMTEADMAILWLMPVLPL